MNDRAKEQRMHRARKRERGYVLKQIWVKPEKWIEIKRYIDDCNAGK